MVINKCVATKDYIQICDKRVLKKLVYLDLISENKILHTNNPNIYNIGNYIIDGTEKKYKLYLVEKGFYNILVNDKLLNCYFSNKNIIKIKKASRIKSNIYSIKMYLPKLIFMLNEPSSYDIYEDNILQLRVYMTDDIFSGIYSVFLSNIYKDGKICQTNRISISNHFDNKKLKPINNIAEYYIELFFSSVFNEDLGENAYNVFKKLNLDITEYFYNCYIQDNAYIEKLNEIYNDFSKFDTLIQFYKNEIMAFENSNIFDNNYVHQNIFLSNGLILKKDLEFEFNSKKYKILNFIYNSDDDIQIKYYDDNIHSIILNYFNISSNSQLSINLEPIQLDCVKEDTFFKIKLEYPDEKFLFVKNKNFYKTNLGDVYIYVKSLNKYFYIGNIENINQIIQDNLINLDYLEKYFEDKICYKNKPINILYNVISQNQINKNSTNNKLIYNNQINYQLFENYFLVCNPNRIHEKQYTNFKEFLKDVDCINNMYYSDNFYFHFIINNTDTSVCITNTHIINAITENTLIYNKIDDFCYPDIYYLYNKDENKLTSDINSVICFVNQNKKLRLLKPDSDIKYFQKNKSFINKNFINDELLFMRRFTIKNFYSNNHGDYLNLIFDNNIEHALKIYNIYDTFDTLTNIECEFVENSEFVDKYINLLPKTIFNMHNKFYKNRFYKIRYHLKTENPNVYQFILNNNAIVKLYRENFEIIDSDKINQQSTNISKKILYPNKHDNSNTCYEINLVD